MNLHRKKAPAHLVHVLFMLGAAGLFTGCGSQTDHDFKVTEPGCAPHVAQIMVLDGFSKRLCGCAETANTVIYPPASLSCTVASGTTIFFHITGAKLRHQIVPVGSPGIQPSPAYNPSRGQSIFTFPVTVSGASATQFSYRDQYDANINGQILIQ